MALLKPLKDRKHRKVMAFTVVRCMMSGHQVTFCHRLCKPLNGRGACGRPAPHALKSIIQEAMELRRPLSPHLFE